MEEKVIKEIDKSTSSKNTPVVQLGFSSDKKKFLPIHDQKDILSNNNEKGKKYVADLLCLMEMMLNQRIGLNEGSCFEHDLVSTLVKPLRSITDEGNYLFIFNFVKDYIHNSQTKKFITPGMILAPLLIHLCQDKRMESHIEVTFNGTELEFDQGAQWEKLIKPYSRASIGGEHIGSGWLVKAIYNLITGPMAPPFDPDKKEAVVERVSVIVDKITDVEKTANDGSFVLELQGRGSFGSENDFHVSPDDATQHNLRDPIATISEALGGDLPKIYRLGKKPESFSLSRSDHEDLGLPTFAIVQWVEDGIPLYVMRLVF